MKLEDLAAWTPIWIHHTPNGPLVDWADLNQQRFSEPFFEQSVEQALRQPYQLLFRHFTPLDALPALQATRPRRTPSGFIFHLSRCGSTLVSQMLAALPQNLVLSEPGPLEGLLRLRYYYPQLPIDQHIALLQGLVSALTEPHHGEQHSFIKFDSWHTLDLALIQQAFPTVPWIFVHRDPLEVLVSNIRVSPGRLMSRFVEAAMLDLDLQQALSMSLEEFCARALGAFCRSVIEQRQPTTRLVAYPHLPGCIPGIVRDSFKIPLSAEDEAIMLAAARFDVKAARADVPFTDDRAQKQAAITPAIRAAAATFIDPIYARLIAGNIRS